MENRYVLPDEIFRNIQKLVYDSIGVNLTDSKRALVVSRLSKRLRELGFNDFEQYCAYLKENEEEKIEPISRLTPFSSITLSGADDFRLEIRGELEYDLLQLDWRRTGLGLNLKLPGAGPDSFYVFDFQGDYGNRQGAWQELNFQLKRILDCYSFNFNYEAVDQVFSLGFDLNI